MVQISEQKERNLLLTEYIIHFQNIDVVAQFFMAVVILLRLSSLMGFQQTLLHQLKSEKLSST